MLRFRASGPLFDWAIFAATFSRLEWRWLILGCLLAYATYFGRALRWAVLLRAIRPNPDLWELTKANLIGFTAILLLGRPGEIVRPYLISVKTGTPLTSQLAIWFLERMFDMVFALGIFGFGLSLVSVSRTRLGGPLKWLLETGGSLVWILSAICLILLVVLRKYPEVFRERVNAALDVLPDRYAARTQRLVDSFVEGIRPIRSTPAVVWTIALTAVEWMLIAASNLAVLWSFGANKTFGLVDVLIYMGFVTMGTIVQLPGIGGGMQVVSVIVLHEIFDMPVETAAGVTLVIWLTTFVILLPVGIPLALHEG
ncbi:MAG TPA: lysylphosphatidylglycerol synthase transmembrane domain-containing protein, partial [Bryobacteraceae bacterium]|nr:lysylphosphatidylglycerol synthase transmembrane domain-containing protein [Bryobacteraceae bacterium]